MINCAVCGGEATQLEHRKTCSKCGHLFRDKENNLEFQKAFHLLHTRSSNEVVNRKIDWKVFHANRQWIVDARYEKIKGVLHKSFDCLDIGAGGGTFANRIKSSVRNVECLEIADFLSDEIAAQGFKTYTNDFLEHNFEKTYDVVFAWHILEHIIDIENFLKKCDELSTRYVVIEIPVERDLPKIFDGHIHMFNKESLGLCLRQQFTNVKIIDGVQKPALLAIIEK
jgi:hypothetical protein